MRYTYFFAVVSIRSEMLDFEDFVVHPFHQLIGGVIRCSDFIGILGDRNIAIILHDTDTQNINKIVRRMRGKIQDYLVEPKKQAMKIRWACFPTHAATAEDLLGIVEGEQDVEEDFPA